MDADEIQRRIAALSPEQRAAAGQRVRHYTDSLKALANGGTLPPT